MRRGGAVEETDVRRRGRTGSQTQQGAARPTPGAPRYAKPLSTAGLIGWTVLSIIVPGAAHLRAGKRRVGFMLLGAFVLLLAGGVIYGLQFAGNAGAALRDSTLNTLLIAAGAGALAWFSLVLFSYIALRPQRLPQSGQIVSGVVAGVLCVAVMAPFGLAASTVSATKDFLQVFPTDVGPSASAIKAEDPWRGRKRVNFLLIGGDAAGNRTGVRTDSMTVASVNIATGNTVLFSLPRNLQHVRFPAGSPLGKQFPNGFHSELPLGGLLNEVWQYAEENPTVMGAKHQGPHALKQAIGYTLDLHIDYYAMVDMYGFAALIDAIGGLKINVQQDVKFGGKFGTAGTIKAGYRKLSGEEVLWYGRSRVNSDDFSRMARQRCVIAALAQQASPATVLANFTKIVKAAKRMFRTDIPQPLLEHLVNLGLKVKGAKISSTQFVPPDIWPGSADWLKIRRMTRQAILESMSSSRTLAAGARSTSPSPKASRAGSSSAPSTASPGGSAGGRSIRPTPNKTTKTLAEQCGF